MNTNEMTYERAMDAENDRFSSVLYSINDEIEAELEQMMLTCYGFTYGGLD